jgi:hypothetical protein
MAVPESKEPDKINPPKEVFLAQYPFATGLKDKS